MIGQGEIPARQARSRKTRENLVKALEALLHEKTFDQISITELADHAGVSVGTVYRRFSNKDAMVSILFDLYDQRVREFGASQNGRVITDPKRGLAANLRELVRLTALFLAQNRHIARAAFIQARERPDLFAEKWTAIVREGVAALHRFLELFEQEVRQDDRAEAAQYLFYALNTLIFDRGLYPACGAGVACQLSDQRFQDAVTASLYGYLSAPPAGAPHSN